VGFLFLFFASVGESEFSDAGFVEVAETFRRTVRSSGGEFASLPSNHAIISRTSSPWLAGMP